MKWTVGFTRQRLIAGNCADLQFEGVEIVALESANQDAAHLTEIARAFEFFDGASHGEIVDHDLPLVDGALRHPAKFTELQITKMPRVLPVGHSRNRLSMANIADTA